MPDEITPGGSQTTPPANITPGQTAATGSQTTPAPQVIEDEEDKPVTLREARRLRDQIKEYRLAAESAQSKIDEAERAKLGDLEKAQKDAGKYQQQALELQQQLQEMTLRSAIKDAAGKLGFNDPEDALMLLLRSGDLEFDEDGTPKNADKLLKALAENKPYLLKAATPTQPQAGVFPANPSRSGQSAKPDFRNPANVRASLMNRDTWKEK